MITLTYNGITAELSEDLKWSDEFDWNPVQQTAQRTVTGALIVDSHSMIGGRNITLQPPDENSAWMSLAELLKIKSFAAVTGAQMTLVMNGVSRTVMFRHQDGQALEAEPIYFFRDRENSDFYLVTLRLMEL